MAGKKRPLIELFEQAVQESEDENGLNPDTDLSWNNHDDHEPDYESDYHE
jgi:hypothetical protein